MPTPIDSTQTWNWLEQTAKELNAKHRPGDMELATNRDYQLGILTQTLTEVLNDRSYRDRVRREIQLTGK